MASMIYVMARCREQGVPFDRVVALHADLGEAEWPGTTDLVREHCAEFGLRLEIASYRNREGKHLSLLDYVRARGKWPSSSQRYCTSEYKRSPCGRLLTKLKREGQGPILNVMGFRAAESPARAKRHILTRNRRSSTRNSEVFDWLPIHDWSEKEVWEAIALSGMRHHQAYDLGMPRLSCMFCIFAPKPALAIAALANPVYFDEYCRVESEIGHDFRKGFKLQDLRKELEAGYRPDLASCKERWVM